MIKRFGGRIFGKEDTLTPANRIGKRECLSSSQEARKETCGELQGDGRKGES